MDISKLIQSPKMNHLNAFRRKHGIPRNIYKEVLTEMFEKYGDKKKHHFFKTRVQENKFAEILSQNFTTFLGLLTEKTGKTWKKRPERIWDDDWNESNLDGSFAYNGVTEDF